MNKLRVYKDQVNGCDHRIQVTIISSTFWNLELDINSRIYNFISMFDAIKLSNGWLANSVNGYEGLDKLVNQDQIYMLRSKINSILTNKF